MNIILNTLLALLFVLLPLDLYLAFTQNNSPLEVRVALLMLIVAAVFHAVFFTATKSWFWRAWSIGFGLLAVFQAVHQVSLL